MLATLIGKNLLARPLRYVLTGLSIAFGVAAVTAVFIFTDGLRTTFDELGGNIQAGYDIAVQNDNAFGDGFEPASRECRTSRQGRGSRRRVECPASNH